MNIETALKKYGFDEREVEIYLYLLRNLEATAFAISRDTGIPKTTVYYSLEKMRKNDFISMWRKNNIKYYSLESPNQLLYRLRDKEETIKLVMPQIRALTNETKHRPIVRLYTGQTGVKSALDEVLEDFKSGDVTEVLQFIPEGIFEKLPTYFPKWIEMREKMKIRTKVIAPIINNKSRFSQFYKNTENKDLRFLKDDLPFDGWVHMYNNKIVSVTIEGEEIYSIIVESYATTKMFTRFFEFTFNSLPRSE